MPLYQIPSDTPVVQIKPSSFASEKELQNLFESNLLILLGVRFIDSEFVTGGLRNAEFIPQPKGDINVALQNLRGCDRF